MGNLKQQLINKVMSKISTIFDIAALEAKKYTTETSLADKKRIATSKKEPWVAVSNLDVDPGNLKNGFIELDWNEYFIELLRSSGYSGNNDNEVIDKWFNDLISQISKEGEEH